MHLLRVISPSAWTEGRDRTSKEDSLHHSKEHRFAAGGKIASKSRPRQSDSSSSSNSLNTSAVTAMEFTCGGRVLLVLHSNGAVTATDTNFSGSRTSHGNCEWEVGNRDVEEGDRGMEMERDISIGPVTSLVCAPLQKDGSAEVYVPSILATCITALHSGYIFTVLRGNAAKIYKVSLPSSSEHAGRATGSP